MTRRGDRAGQWYWAALAGLMLSLLAGCTVGPNYQRPPVPVAPAFRGADGASIVGTDAASLGDEKWAAVFREPQLQNLIRTALSNNYDVRIAAQRVLEQQAQLKIVHAQEFPTLSVGGTGLGAELPDSLSNTLGSSLYAGSFSLSAAWTPDFWGLYRRQTQAARAQLLAQEWAQRAVRMTLVEQVASTFIQLNALDRQLTIAKETLRTRQQSVDLTRRLADGGSAPLSDLREAQELEYTASSQIPAIDQQIQQQENALRLLLGEDPGPVVYSNETALAPPPQSPPVGLPSRLLERRPDIEEAEQQLIAANAQIGVARAEFFPQLSISASGGVGGDEWSNLFDPAGHTIYGLGSLVQPIFEGGRLRGQLQLSEHEEEELVLNYQKTIAGAFRDVSNALIALNKQRASREQQTLLVAAAQDAARLAQMRYQGGATSYLEVLTTDSNLFSAQLNLVNSQEGEALSLVQLYAALGGGW
ncbi:MAG TPA: efflux transporter outer membrane subunit [Acidobacteriaceae bacterium]|nr:efflux transporter outer membrane subunit [Acidobacteriaceae bacterium]